MNFPNQYPYPWYPYYNGRCGWTPPITVYRGGWVPAPPQMSPAGVPQAMVNSGGGCGSAVSYRPPQRAWWLDPYCSSAPCWPWPRPPSCCPQVLVGGSCCSGCAEGKGCSETPVVAAITVSADERNEVQAQLVQFASDVDVAEQKESQDRAKNYAAAAAATACFAAGLTWDSVNLKCVQIADPTHQSFKNIPQASFQIQIWRQERLAPLLHRWDEYQQLAATPFVSPTVASFEQIKADFQTLVAEWTHALGQKTSAVPPPVATKGALDSFGGGIDKAAGVLGQIGTYAIVGGAVVAGVYFLGPTLFAAMRKKKAVAA